MRDDRSSVEKLADLVRLLLICWCWGVTISWIVLLLVFVLGDYNETQ